MRDLDFGRQLVEYFQQLDWPQGVVVEDLCFSVPLVLHRLEELRPAKVVLVGAVARELDPPATLRRYRPDLTPAGPAQVHRSMEDGLGELVDIDHTLAVARHWGRLPADTVVIEVEPAEIDFGLGFSEALATCFDPILDMVREELAGTAPDLEDDVGEVDEPVDDLVDYARDHVQARHQAPRPAAAVDGVEMVGRVRPWGVFVESGGDWFDAVRLDGGAVGIVVGNVAGRGVEVASAMSDLRAAVRAYAAIDGDAPARLIGHLDRLAATSGLGRQARVVYVVLDPATGEARFVSAGGCPPLLLSRSGARFADAADSGALGAADGADRSEATLRLTPDATLLLCTDGLVESRAVPRAAGLERLRRAAVTGPDQLDRLCDHVLGECTADGRRDDDICLLGVRLLADAVPARRAPTHR
jgi:hydrogenase maturation protease